MADKKVVEGVDEGIVVIVRERQRQSDEAAPRGVDAARKHLEMKQRPRLGRRMLGILRLVDRLVLEMHAQDRADACDLDRDAVPLAERVQPGLQGLASLGQRVRNVRT